jgi:hypothetical protein
MIRIAITEAAFNVIVDTFPLGSTSPRLKPAATAATSSGWNDTPLTSFLRCASGARS